MQKREIEWADQEDVKRIIVNCPVVEEAVIILEKLLLFAREGFLTTPMRQSKWHDCQDRMAAVIKLLKH